MFWLQELNAGAQKWLEALLHPDENEEAYPCVQLFDLGEDRRCGIA